MSSGPTEADNTELRLLIRIAYWFKVTDYLIALRLLDRGPRHPADHWRMTHGK